MSRLSVRDFHGKSTPKAAPVFVPAPPYTMSGFIMPLFLCVSHAGECVSHTRAGVCLTRGRVCVSHAGGCVSTLFRQFDAEGVFPAVGRSEREVQHRIGIGR